MSKKVMKYSSKLGIRWFAVLGLSMSMLIAEKQADPQNVLDALNMRQDIEAQLKKMTSWEDELLLQFKVKKTMNSLLKDDTLSKRARLALLDFNQTTMLPKEGFDQDKFGEHLFNTLSSSSPSLQKRSIEILINLDGLKSAALISKLEKLITEIFTDASADEEDQKYPTALHAIALKSLNVSKASSKQVNSIEDLLKKADTLSPSTRIALFQVIGYLFEAKPSGLSRSAKADLGKLVSTLIQNHPGTLAVGASEGEVEELAALLFSIQHMISDKDLSSLVAKLHPTLLKLLAQPIPSIAKASGDSLISLQKSDNRTKVKSTIGALFLSQLSATMKTKAPTNEKAVYLSKSLANLVGYFLESEEKEELAQIAPILKALGPLSFYPIDEAVRLAILDAFFTIEPRHLEDKKLLSTETKAFLGAFFKQSVAFLLDPKKQAEKPAFTDYLSKVLYEITGKDLGKDGKQWGEWLRKDGKELFN